MNNNYEVAEVIEIGKAQDVILGSSKLQPIYNDSPSQFPRQTPVVDDE